MTISLCKGDSSDHGDALNPEESEELNQLIQELEHGDAEAQALVGAELSRIEQYEDAFPLLKASAEQSCAKAMGHLAIAYLLGQGTPMDVKAALLWARRGVLAGESVSQFVLGFCYQHGAGVEIDAKESLYWFRACAEQDDAIAQGVLAGWFHEGIHVDRDPVEALMWAMLSCERDDTNDEVQRLQASLIREMSKGQIKEAKLRAKAWREEHRLQG